ATIEIVGKTDEILRQDALRDLLHEIARQLTNLDVLEVQLAPRVATRDVGAHQRRNERLLLRLCPAAKIALEVDERNFDSPTIVAMQRALKIIEAAPQRALRRQQRFEPRCQSPAIPGSMRTKPSSIAHKSIDSETRSSIGGIGRASTVISIDFT